MNALALHSSGMNLAKIVGPSIAGILIGVVGVGWCLAINGLSFVAILISLFMMHPPAFFKNEIRPGNLGRDLTETFVYLKTNRTMLVLIAASFATMLFGLQSQVVLPIFARYVLNAGPSGFGFLMAAMGAGAVLGGVIMAGLGDLERKGFYFIVFTLSYALLLIFFSLSTWFLLSMAIILLVGMTELLSRTINQTLVQTLSPDTLRGRILGIYMLDRGIRPLGGFLMGTGASLLGGRFALAIGGGMCVVIALGLLLRASSIREL